MHLEASNRIVFTGAKIVDREGQLTGPTDVAVEHGMIAEVGGGLDGDDAIDVTGLTLLPGLFDCHVHMLVSHIDMWRLVETPLTYRILDAARNLARTLAVGITTVRDAAGADLGIKQAIEDGVISGPRMQISICIMSQTGGHTDGWMRSGQCVHTLFPDYPGSVRSVVNGLEEVRGKVRELVRAGADVIKVAATGGVLSPTDSPKHTHFSREELDLMVSEARAAGLVVMAHAQGTQGIKNAVRAGVRSIEHGIYLDDESIELMLDRGTFLVPTLGAPRAVIQDSDRGNGVSPSLAAKAAEVLDAHEESFRQAVAAGLPIAMGTDSGITPHGANLDELELMASLGMSREDCIRSATSVAADLLGVGHKSGSIEPGKRADLVTVEGDPYDFGTLADRVLDVYKDGRVAWSRPRDEDARLPTPSLAC